MTIVVSTPDPARLKADEPTAEDFERDWWEDNREPDD